MSYWYAKANKKYTKDYDKNKESSYLSYWAVNNLYRWVKSNFKWVEFDEFELFLNLMKGL